MVINEEKLTRCNLSFDDANKAQNELCTRLNLSFDKVQNEPIKDNIIDNNETDNNCFLLPSGNKKGGSLAKAKAAITPKRVSREWLDSNGVEYETIVDSIVRIKGTGAVVEIY